MPARLEGGGALSGMAEPLEHRAEKWEPVFRVVTKEAAKI
jgi:hypothetical protein